MKNNESKLQQVCVKWFRLQYPQYKKLLFSIPNGGKRNVITASIMKAEGAVAGVADLMLAIPKNFGTEFGSSGLFIEMKSGKNKLSAEQQKFKDEIETMTYRHITCYSFDEFKNVIEKYLA